MIAHRTRPVALVGISGAGKSTVAPLLAARLGGTVADLDARIEVRTACPIAELFAREGEASFRLLESEELRRAIAERPAVIACGGGVVESPASRDLLRLECHTVWLEAAVDKAVERVQTVRGAPRPLLAGPDPAARLAEMLARRRRAYTEVAMARVRTDDVDASRVVDRVIAALVGPIPDTGDA